MTFQLSPYRAPHLCPAHAAAAPPPCPRCASEWLDRAEPTIAPSVARRVFVAGVLAATVFGAVIGTAIGFVAGASPLWGSASGDAPRPPRPHELRTARRAPPHRPARPTAPRAIPARPAAPAIAASLAAVRAPAVAPPVAALTPILARLEEPTNDPELLLARLQGLARTGVPVTIETRRLSSATRAALQASATLTRSVRLLPVERDGRVVGLKVFGVRPDGPLHQAGARSGDLLLAVNGIEMGESRWPSHEPFPGDARAAIFELERAGEHRVLVLRW